MQFEAIYNKSGDAIVGIQLHLATAQAGQPIAKLHADRLASYRRAFATVAKVEADLTTRHGCTLEGLVELDRAEALSPSDSLALESVLKAKRALIRAESPILASNALILALQGKGVLAAAITKPIRKVLAKGWSLEGLDVDQDLEDSAIIA